MSRKISYCSVTFKFINLSQLLVVSTEILQGILLWNSKNKNRISSNIALKTIPFLFLTLDSFYNETRKLPLKSVSGNRNKKVNTSYNFTLGIFLNPQEYIKLRNILSLVGDIYNICKSMLNYKIDLLELSQLIDKIYLESNRYREIRNFFTHLDDVLTNMDKHGIDGPYKTRSNIEYMSKTKGNIHLLWDRNKETIFFTYMKKDHENSVRKDTFDTIFLSANDLCKSLNLVIRYPINDVRK